MTELKDVLTPLVTLAGVWLGARFTLRNELSKKALEIRTARLESIAEECNDALTGFLNYAGAMLHLTEIEFRMLSEKAGPDAPATSLRLSAEELTWRTVSLEDGRWAPDPAKMRHCRHQLTFHHPNHARHWEATVQPAVNTLNEFLAVSMPGESIRDIKEVSRSALDEAVFRRSLTRQLQEISVFQAALTDALSGESVALTRPSPPLAARFRSLLHWR